MTRHPFVELMRRYVVDYTNRHDTGVCAQIMEPDYTLRMGPHVVAGRDERYIPASRKQFDQFPGLGLTVHELHTDGDRLVMRFSEHGASARHGGAVAVWTGIGLYRWNGTRLVHNFVEQDYQARRRQLTDRRPDRVPAPAPAPWDTAPADPDPAAEAAVRTWIRDGFPPLDAVRFDDGDRSPLLTDPAAEVDELFGAGPAVAFRLTCRGGYAGGLAGVDDARIGDPAELHLVGLVHVSAGRVAGGQVVRDRLGLARALNGGGPS